MTAGEADAAYVLILAPIGRDAPAAAEVLARVGLRTAICRDLPGLMARIEADVAAILVAEEALFGKDISPLSAWIARQPPWADLPFVILTSHLSRPGVTLWRRQLVDSLRNVSLLERPVQTITLTSAVQAAMRARFRQYEIRALLDAQAHAASRLEELVLARTQQLEAANKELRTQMAERARIEDSLRQAQKIEALGQLTGGVAHDFNNLLMVILGGLEMLDRATAPARRHMLMDGMRQAAQRGASLTRQLLAFSRRQALQPQPVDLAHQIGSMRELLDRSLGENVNVEVEFGPDLWPVQVDPGELELVVLNLAVNARDAMPKGGQITIRAENIPTLESEQVRGDYVRFAISDAGTGMSPEVRARVFEPFFTTKDIGKGSGLGLAQVYGFAKQSGGSVHIESELGRGTTVALLLPRSLETPAIGAQGALDPAPQQKCTLAGSILLVEDDDDVAALVGEMLEELGYQVTRAASASAALGALANGRHIDMVFSDIMMPGNMDGVELGRQIRARQGGIPVLLTSGYAEAAATRAECEGFGVLRKPYSLNDLAAALKAAAPADEAS